MLTKEQAQKLFALENIMVNLLQKYFLLEWDDNADCYHYANDKNYYLEPYDYEYLELSNDIPYEDDFIDGVLIFGDCTIEFHFKSGLDAENWCKFSTDIIESVISELKNIVLAR